MYANPSCSVLFSSILPHFEEFCSLFFSFVNLDIKNTLSKKFDKILDFPCQLCYGADNNPNNRLGFFET